MLCHISSNHSHLRITTPHQLQIEAFRGCPFRTPSKNSPMYLFVSVGASHNAQCVASTCFLTRPFSKCLSIPSDMAGGNAASLDATTISAGTVTLVLP